MAQFFNNLGRRANSRPPNSAQMPRRSPTINTDSAAESNSPSATVYGNGPKPLYLSNPFVKAALVKGNFKTIVAQPRYCDLNEWVAVNIFDFYTNLNMFYGILAEVCTTSNCRTMSAGPTLDYTWIDSSRKQVKLPAPTYIDYVMSWVQQTIDNGKDFPTKFGVDFHPNFPTIAKQIYRQLLRVFAHVYNAHFTHLLHLSAEGHFNSLFAHFLAFGKQYDLLDYKDIKGRPGEGVGIGDLWDKWKEMGILEL
ncbi:Mob1/phocein [Cantharellus anzutake]|uniref:Mob1/phocein n=1 Tax=Cantharellus anzutake TaxID=1750568 RepID=UPI001904D561|nr:Mob1/phocein [Cantharellus anzutake]KAF8340369.1 Mob1/phocein [Cantharellus anzutake]